MFIVAIIVFFAPPIRLCKNILSTRPLSLPLLSVKFYSPSFTLSFEEKLRSDFFAFLNQASHFGKM